MFIVAHNIALYNVSNDFSTNQLQSCAFGFWMSLGPETQSLGLDLEHLCLDNKCDTIT